MSIPFQIKMAEERIIRGDFFPAVEEAKGIVIICHGFKGFKDWGMFPYVAKVLAKEVHVITFNFSYNGVGDHKFDFTELDKFAKNTFSKELEDVEVLVQQIQTNELHTFLSGQHPPVDYNLSNLPIILLGHSRGGGVSLIYAFDHPDHIAGVLSWNGLTRVETLLPQDLQTEIKRSGRGYIYNGRTKQNMPIDKEVVDDMEANKDRFNILERVKLSSTPIALIQGTEDFERLRQGSAQLVENNPSIQWIQIPGGDHTFNTVHPFQGETEPLKQALASTNNFIQSLL